MYCIRTSFMFLNIHWTSEQKNDYPDAVALFYKRNGQRNQFLRPVKDFIFEQCTVTTYLRMIQLRSC